MLALVGIKTLFFFFLGCRGHHKNIGGASGGSTYFVGPSSTHTLRASRTGRQGVPLL